MNQSEALEKISAALARLAYQTSAENLAGMFSKNRLVEYLLLPIFRLALKAPDLQNLNQEVVNFPYIDLAGDHSRLAIQVTTERGSAKVTDTLTKFLTRGYQKRYSRLVFFILTGNKMSYATTTIRSAPPLARFGETTSAFEIFGLSTPKRGVLIAPRHGNVFPDVPCFLR